MFAKLKTVNKASASAIVAALMGFLAAVTDLPPEALTPLGAFLTWLVVYLVPNKE